MNCDTHWLDKHFTVHYANRYWVLTRWIYSADNRLYPLWHKDCDTYDDVVDLWREAKAREEVIIGN